MKRKALSFLFALILILTLPLATAASTGSEARNSVVVVSTCLEMNLGTKGFGHGTGFFVNDQYLVTNYHVIEVFDSLGAGTLIQQNVDGVQVSGRAKIYAHYDSKDYEEAYLVGADSVKDIAILRLANPTTKRTPLTLKPPTDDMVGSSVYAVGFPGLADNIYSDSVSSWGINDSTVTSGTISRLFTQSGTGRRSVQIDCDIKGGNSGGPLVDGNGAAIGVNTESVSDGSGAINYAVSIEEAIQLLEQYRVGYTLFSEESGASVSGWKNGISTDMAVAIAVAAVAIIAAVVLAVLLLRKKKPDPTPAPVPAAPVVPQKVPTIRSCAKINYGDHVSVSGQPVMIGRSSACGLRFPNDAPGVSGSHCSVQWDGRAGDFIVMDLNSTYGTFLMSGQKMTPNTPYRMRPGDRFYLADQNNVIALELE